MKIRLTLFLLAMIVITATIVGFGVRQLALDQFTNQQDQRIRETHQELQNKFRSFDLFMADVEAELDQRLKSVLPEIAQRIAAGPPPAQWSREALNTIATAYSVRDLYLIDTELVIFNTTFPPDLGLNLGSLSQGLKTKLEGLLHSGRVEVDRISMSNKTGIIKKYAYHGPQQADYLVEASFNMWEGAETFGSVAQKRFFLEEFFQSLVDSSDILVELDLFIADDLAQWSLLREGIPMDSKVASRLLAEGRVEIHAPNRLTVYNQLPRRDVISGFRYYSKTVFNTAIPDKFYQEMTVRTLILTLVAAALAFLLVERVIFRWLLSRVEAMDTGIRSMGENTLAPPLDVDGSDELSRIAAAINDLVDKVRHREDQLRMAKEDLELRVASRTQELRQSLEALAEREANYRYLVEHARSIILRWKPNGTITFFNDFAQKYFGYPEADILGKTIYETILPSTETGGRNLYEQLQKIALNPKDFAFHENENICRDGQRVWVAWANRTLPGNDGKPGEVLSVGTDITHLKRVQQELILARNAADAANRAKSEFLAVMSHEIRTPMNVILGMADLLADTDLTTEQKNYLRSFNSAGETLLALINDILDLSKIEANCLELEQVEIDLAELTGDLADIMSVRAREKNLALTVHMDPTMVPVRWGDLARLRQVLINLIGNAIKFTHQGEIKVRVSEPMPEQVLLEVEDTGIGIPADQQQVIFNAFNQGDASVTRRYGGTGLGLAICRRLVNLMGGEIQLSSDLGHGSRFHLTIPMAIVAHPLNKQLYSDLRAGMRILLAGEGSFLSVVQNFLETVSLKVARHQGFAGIDNALEKGEPPEAVIIESGDEKMAVVLACIRVLRSDTIGTSIPLVVLLPEPDRKTILEIQELNATYLIKPLKRRDLLSALNTAQALGKAVSAKVGGLLPTLQKKRSLHILIAEDSPDNVLLLQSYLKRELYQLAVVENGQEAVDRIMDEHFDLVLMDVQMPVMDGLQATRQIRLMERKANRTPIPIIALTAHAMREDEGKSYEAGCNDHLTKPIKKTVLLEAIIRATERDTP
ncbi:MAG: response regulator [Magnetococcales bacterium]|nr:response regulator [Magnetococcales bacterium]